MMKVFFVLTPDIVTRLLGHFLDSSPRWLSTRVGPQRTEFMTWLSPAISDSPLIFNCILAIASGDMLKTHRGNLEMRYAAAEYYGKTISYLRTAIENEMTIVSPSDTPLPDYTPLAVLLLCVHETQNFTESERILPHLNAAVFLLQNRIFRSNGNSGLRSFLFEAFCYFFALASFSLGPKLPLHQAHSIFDAPSVIEYIRTGHIMGTSQVLFVAIYRTSNLALKLASKIPVEVSTARAELMLLDQDLDSGHCNKARNGYDSDTRDLHDIITTELYRLACRIHIRKLLGSSSPEEDLTIYRLVEDFVNELQFLPPNSPSHSILSWPLVVAGFAARHANHQRIIVARLAQIHDEWQSDVFSKSAAYLQEKWKGDKFPKQGILDTSNFRGSSGIRTPWNNCPVLLA